MPVNARGACVCSGSLFSMHAAVLHSDFRLCNGTVTCKTICNGHNDVCVFTSKYIQVGCIVAGWDLYRDAYRAARNLMGNADAHTGAEDGGDHLLATFHPTSAPPDHCQSAGSPAANVAAGPAASDSTTAPQSNGTAPRLPLQPLSTSAPRTVSGSAGTGRGPRTATPSTPGGPPAAHPTGRAAENAPLAAVAGSGGSSGVSCDAATSAAAPVPGLRVRCMKPCILQSLCERSPRWPHLGDVDIWHPKVGVWGGSPSAAASGSGALSTHHVHACTAMPFNAPSPSSPEAPTVSHAAHSGWAHIAKQQGSLGRTRRPPTTGPGRAKLRRVGVARGSLVVRFACNRKACRVAPTRHVASGAPAPS